jgi:hypothetical protein
MKTTVAGRWHLALLGLILLLALVVRVIGITYGLPYVYYPDEAVIVNHAVAFGTGDLNPHYFIYPSLYMYVLFVIYSFIYVIGWLIGTFASTDDFIRLFFNDATPFYLPGRLLAALSGVASVAMVYVVGRRSYNVTVGVVASSFLAFSVMHVEFSHYVKTHVPAGLLVILCLNLAWSIYVGTNQWRHYLWAGVVAGLAASTVYHAGFVLISVIVAHVLKWRDSRDGSRPALFDARIIGAVGASFVAFVLGTPFALLDWRTFVTELGSTATTYSGGGFWEQGTLYPLTSLGRTIGSPLGLVTILGLGYACLRFRPVDIILASQPLFLAGFLMLFPTKEAHHMLIAMPALTVLGASLLVDLIGWCIRHPLVQPAAIAVATASLVIAPATQSLASSLRMSQPDTRDVAKKWIEENIPPGSRIVMDSGKYYLGSFGPPLRISRWSVERLLSQVEPLDGEMIARRNGSRRIGYAGEVEYFREQLRTMDDSPGYDIVRILHDVGSSSADVLPLDEYLEQGIQYAILSSYGWDQYHPGGETAVRHPGKTTKYRNLYDAVETSGRLLREFKPSERIRGPVLRIYDLQNSSDVTALRRSGAVE